MEGDKPARETTWSRRTFAALRVPAFRRFFVTQGISLVGSFARATALGWLVFDLTGSEALLGTVGLLSYLPIAVLAPFASALAERWDKRRLLIGCNVAFCLCAAALAALTATGLVAPDHVLAFALLTGIAAAVEIPARQAFFVEMVGKSDLRNAIALNAALFDFTLVLGPLVAGLLLWTVGMTVVFVVDAITFLPAIFGFVGMRLPPREEVPRVREPAWARLTAGARYARHDPFLRSMLVLLAVAMAFGWSYWALLPAFARDVLGEGEFGYAVMYSASGVGAVAGALFVAGHHGRNPQRTVAVFLVLVSVTLVGFAASRSLWVACLCRAVIGFSMIGFITTATTAMQMSVPDALRARVIGVWTLVWGTCYPLGQQAMGLAAERFGTPTTIAIGGILCLACTLAVTLRRGRTVAAVAR